MTVNLTMSHVEALRALACRKLRIDGRTSKTLLRADLIEVDKRGTAKLTTNGRRVLRAIEKA